MLVVRSTLLTSFTAIVSFNKRKFLKRLQSFLIAFLYCVLLNGQSLTDTLKNPVEIGEYKKIETGYKANFVFQIGGESKLTLLPKFNLLRAHNLCRVSPYYGLEAGIYPLFVAGAYTLSALTGIENNFVFIETSISIFGTTKVKDYKNNLSGYYRQNQLNIKIGFSVKSIRIKLGTSYLISEYIPSGQSRIPLLDLGKIGNNTYGIELQFKIK